MDGAAHSLGATALRLAAVLALNTFGAAQSCAFARRWEGGREERGGGRKPKATGWGSGVCSGLGLVFPGVRCVAAELQPFGMTSSFSIPGVVCRAPVRGGACA